ncbi:PAS/PAC sensor signal transduction histidine kinase [Calothrix sp. NIES-4071]|nr:PAS/PAC sensor signal transduction histidine kinase [Calothrix sp. NIES-4071]BAZ58226.1 PAS/PAC sensor signal transduction histidine kinase [Calothrix sp. NIES-4105]
MSTKLPYELNTLQARICYLETVVSQQVQLEAALRQSESTYHQILDAINDLVIIKGADSRIIWANKAFCEFYGITREELVGFTDIPFNEPEHVEKYIKDDQYVFETGKTLVIPKERALRHDRKVRVLNTTKSAVRNIDGEVIMTFAISRDVTVEMATKKALEQKAVEYRNIFEAVTDGILIYDIEAKNLVEVNPAACKMHGYTYEEFLKLPPTVYIHPNSQKKFEELVEAVKNDNNYSYQAFYVRQDDTTIEVEVKAGRCIYNGKPHLLTVVRDISERKQVEIALREKEQRLSNINSLVPGAIYQCEIDLKTGESHFNYLSSKAQIIFELDSSELVEGANPIIPLIHPEDFTSLVFSINTAAHQNAPWYCEFRVITRSGKQKWIYGQSEPVGEKSKRTLYNGIFIDITEQKLAQDKIKQQAQELTEALQEIQRTQTQFIHNEKMSSLGQLVAGIAHEINNPISFIYGNIEPARRYIQDLFNLIAIYQENSNLDNEIIAQIEAIELEYIMEDLPKLLQSMKMGADRIKKIVLSLRNFSRMDEAEYKKVNVHDGIDSSLMILEHRLKQNNRVQIEIVKEYGDLPLVECYAGQLNQVFLNLLTNAIDAFDKTLINNELLTKNTINIKPTIHIITEATTDSYITVCISDNGIGIPKETQAKIFDPFFTTKPVGKGTGMGLSICYQIITQKHNGLIRCLSAPGEGTTFIIRIPLSQGKLND